MPAEARRPTNPTSQNTSEPTPTKNIEDVVVGGFWLDYANFSGSGLNGIIGFTIATAMILFSEIINCENKKKRIKIKKNFIVFISFISFFQALQLLTYCLHLPTNLFQDIKKYFWSLFGFSFILLIPMHNYFYGNLLSLAGFFLILLVPMFVCNQIF